jgi:hypothetical protein
VREYTLRQGVEHGVTALASSISYFGGIPDAAAYYFVFLEQQEVQHILVVSVIYIARTISARP